MSIRKEKLSKISKIRDKTTSQKKIKKPKNLFTPPLRSRKQGTKGNKNIKVTSKEKKPVKGQKYKTSKVSAKGKKGRTRKSQPRKPNSKVLLAARSANRTTTKGQSPIALLTLINKILPRELMKNIKVLIGKS